MDESEDDINIPWLVDYFSQITYHTTLVDPKIDKIEQQCKRLFQRDYNIEILNNQGGELCGHYPRHLVVPTTYKEWFVFMKLIIIIKSLKYLLQININGFDCILYNKYNRLGSPTTHSHIAWNMLEYDDILFGNA